MRDKNLRQGRGAVFAVLFAFAFILRPNPAFAIPSPELIVGSFTSVSQLIALVSAFIGGGAGFLTLTARRSRSLRLSRWAVGVAFFGVILMITSIGLNIYQFVNEKYERRAQLEDTLLRPSSGPTGPAHDSDTKELTYAEQLRHPKRMTTGDAATLLSSVARGERKEVVFLDVREAAEREMGTLPGATFVRFPDLPASKINLIGKKVVLFCHSGDRSSEVCEELAKRGIDCQFIVGGLEKWVVENRSGEGLQARSLETLRAIPEYPNRTTLLDTDAFKRLVQKSKAIIVDVRPPTDFARQHISGAINLSLRRTPTEELIKRMAELPRRPIVLPCYDRRSCFFAEVLGYELTKYGHDYRGRYTLPWEYFVARPRPPYVEQWASERNQSIWTTAGRYVAEGLESMGQWTGLIPAILLLALLSRILVLPFSLKTERDQIRARAVSGKLDELKARLKDDPMRRTRAIRAFYKHHGLTPLRNLVALLFLPIMALALIAVQTVASEGSARFLWVDDLAARDPWLILPILFGALITLYLDVAFARSKSYRMFIWCLAFPLLTATGAFFSAGANIYLIASAALLVIQRATIDGQFTRLRQAYRRLYLGNLTLDDADLLSGYGNKAYRLACLRREGLPVPDGVVFTPSILQEFERRSPRSRERHLDRIWRTLGRSPVAVRSSASAEDGASRSFAGVFDSILNVDRQGLAAAIHKVIASFDADRALSYAGGGGSGSILVQRMIAADYSGVLFTRDPSAGGLSIVELVRGTAEGLVSGTVVPQTYRFGRTTGHPIGAGVAPVDLKQLLILGRRAEELFGAPQDIEWTYKAGHFYLVQSRDITAVNADNSGSLLRQTEFARILDLVRAAAADEIVFAKNEMSEMLPRPTPLSLSLMASLWASGGSVDLACRNLGLAYEVAEDSENYLVTIFGRLYVNEREQKRRKIKISRLAARRLVRRADEIESNFRQQFLPRFLEDIRIGETADLTKLSTPELFDFLARVHDSFVFETHVEVDTINIATNFLVEVAKHHLTKRGHDSAHYLGQIPETYEASLIANALGAPVQAKASLLLGMGHRAVLDYELSEPRYAENSAPLSGYLDMARRATKEPANNSAARGTDGALAQAVDIARRFEALKEDAKHHSLRELALLRRVILSIDQRLKLDGLSFFLEMDELFSLRNQPGESLRHRAAHRKNARAQLLEAPPLASRLTAVDLELLSGGTNVSHHDAGGMIFGTRVSGSGIVEGRACVVPDADAERGAGLAAFNNGDIIVASMIHPAWLPYFARAGGLICEVGGWLSHTAILAREYNTTMIVGTENILAINDRDMLRLHADGRVEIITVGHLHAIAAE